MHNDVLRCASESLDALMKCLTDTAGAGAAIRHQANRQIRNLPLTENVEQLAAQRSRTHAQAETAWRQWLDVSGALAAELERCGISSEPVILFTRDGRLENLDPRDGAGEPADSEAVGLGWSLTTVLRPLAEKIGTAIGRAAAVSVSATSSSNATAGTSQALAGRGHTTHSADFTFVRWYGTEYTFALGVQSSAVKTLWDEWEKTGLGMHQDTIRNAVDSERDTFRMDKAFRNHPAFGTMIRNSGDGKYRLAAHEVRKADDPKVKKSARIPAKARRKPR